MKQRVKLLQHLKQYAKDHEGEDVNPQEIIHDCQRAGIRLYLSPRALARYLQQIPGILIHRKKVYVTYNYHTRSKTLLNFTVVS